MNIEMLKNRISNYKGKTLNFRFNGSRNQIEEFSGKIIETYDSIFTIMVEEKNFLKSVSYSDILIKKLIVINR